MKITVNKCKECGAIFEDAEKYQEHMADEGRKIAFLFRYPKVEDDNCKFANGGWSVQRSKEWHDSYRDDIVELVNISSYPPLSYGWFRTLDDGGSMFYGLACRITNICPKCFREWGQAYYANNCNHVDKEKEPCLT